MEVEHVILSVEGKQRERGGRDGSWSYLRNGSQTRHPAPRQPHRTPVRPQEGGAAAPLSLPRRTLRLSLPAAWRQCHRRPHLCGSQFEGGGRVGEAEE